MTNILHTGSIRAWWRSFAGLPARFRKLKRWEAKEQQIESWLVTQEDDYKLGESTFKREFEVFSKMSATAGRTLSVAWKDRFPCLKDKTTSTGFDQHYIYHPAWAARVLAKTSPTKHVDISSTLHFCSMMSAFLEVDFYDYRPAPLALKGLTTAAADLTCLALPTGSIYSLSCMHVLEHIGLGRYGDVIDPEGDLKAIDELIRVLAPGGNLLVVVPVGRSRVMFNAHRIYAHTEFVEYFGELKLTEFALIPDAGGLIINPTACLADQQEYGCGCYWFRKP